MAGGPYYTLVASLPALPHFELAKELPINPERLRRRLGMLDDEDQQTVEIAEAFLHWQRQPIERTDAEIVRRYERIMGEAHDPTLQDLARFRLEIRTVIAALRRRRLGRPPPEPGERWGVGRFVRRIERQWHDPDFGLAGDLPWLGEARRLMDSGEARALEALVLKLLWEHLDRRGGLAFFGFEAVLVYLFKWDVLFRWLTYAAEPARARFDDLLEETLGDHRQLFA
jgi:hypothetical protein